MNFEMGPDMTLQSYSSSEMYPIALEDDELCSAMNDPSNYWFDDSWQCSKWPTTNASSSTGLADMSDDSSLAYPAVYPMQATLDNNNTTFVYPEQLQVVVGDCYPVAQSVSEAHIEDAQPHDCQKVKALEERIDNLEKLLSSRETE
jgi:hypothetical protein